VKINIRYVKETDLKEIVDIHNQAIRTRSSTAFLNEFTVDERKEWFLEHTHTGYPILIAEQNNKIIGWTSLSPYRKGRKALGKAVLVSYFVHSDFRRKGIGTKLLNEIIIEARNLGYETLLAIIFDSNVGSVKLLEKYNFEKWGFLPDIAEIEGNKISHIYYGKKL
jgi:phosphinothricin acetyltransferase